LDKAVQDETRKLSDDRLPAGGRPAQYARSRRGYGVERLETRTNQHALSVRRSNEEALLTFPRREQVTRLEILFVAAAGG
jgi:hypothetical protein